MAVKPTYGAGRAGRTRARLEGHWARGAEPKPAQSRDMRGQWTNWFNSDADLKSRLSGLQRAAKERGRSEAREQYEALKAIDRAAVDNGMPIGRVTLGVRIMAQQGQRIAQRGNSAYPLSDKQIDTVLRELTPYRRKR